jgi:hypothetical protein
MHDESTHPLLLPDAVNDGTIMAMLLTDDGQRPWAVEEVVREFGNEVAVIDSLNRLHGGGLIHRLDGFVFATRAALRSDQLAR